MSVRRAKKRAAAEKSANATPIKEVENMTLLDGEKEQDTEHERLSKLFQAAAAAYSVSCAVPCLPLPPWLS